jgi:hypothetical protein
MQKKQSNFERIILGLIAVVAIATAGWLIYLKMGFPDTLQPKPVKQSNVMEPPPKAKVDEAIKRAAETPQPWVAPVRNNKAVPLNRAVLLALKGEEIIDMFLEDPLVRPPMSNAFLRENNLEWQYPNVGELDPDDDGFNNLEEFTKNTKPKDAQSHPPITDKLFVSSRVAKDYRIILRNASGQVSLLDEPRNKNAFLTPANIGKDPPQFFGGAGGDRFKAVKFEVKKMPDPRLGEKDVSELTIEEIVTKRQIVLVMGTETNLAEYSVIFQFRLKFVTDLPPVGKEGLFRIPGHEETTYKVIDIQEDKAVISALDAGGQPGPEIIINKG